MYRPLFDLAITILEERMPFLKYEAHAKSICNSIDVL